MTRTSPRELAEIQQAKRRPVVAIATKTDRVDRQRLAEHLIAIDQLGEWDEIVPCSAVDGAQVDEVAEVLGLVPARARPARCTPRGVLTDEPEAVMIAELVREAALEGVRDELPHSPGRRRRGDDPARGAARGQPAARRAGQRVRRAARRRRPSSSAGAGRGCARSAPRARQGIEALLGQRVYLDLHVKIAKDWQRDPKQLQRLGF